MGKDSKGHGSNPRGTSAVAARNQRMFDMFDRAKVLKAQAAEQRAGLLQLDLVEMLQDPADE